MQRQQPPSIIIASKGSSNKWTASKLSPREKMRALSMEIVPTGTWHLFFVRRFSAVATATLIGTIAVGFCIAAAAAAVILLGSVLANNAARPWAPRYRSEDQPSAAVLAEQQPFNVRRRGRRAVAPSSSSVRPAALQHSGGEKQPIHERGEPRVVPLSPLQR
mmetsp:Transcript_49202/g.148089  ORF Transcript_49202/g.148089 Transcript_49202/m.148089 type:complete len:162 (+) Transcript_49202:272-757(+)